MGMTANGYKIYFYSDEKALKLDSNEKAVKLDLKL